MILAKVYWGYSASLYAKFIRLSSNMEKYLNGTEEQYLNGIEAPLSQIHVKISPVV